MSSQTKDSKDTSSFHLGFNALPQYGFGPDLTFESLVQHNPFLFRVYAPKPLPPYYDNSEPFFIAPKFKNGSRFSFEDIDPPIVGSGATYADVANHMDGSRKATSPYVTASFSFAWAIWEAARRYNANPKHEIEIAVIDARSLTGRAVTALELLRQGSAKERHPDHWKWYRLATEAQDVLVYGYIPGTAVFASIPILSILPKLPSYFLSANSANDEKHFNSLAWDVTAPAANFQQFCQQMSEQFLRSPAEIRLRDTTAGAVHLSMGFLRQWFQNHALKQFHDSVYLVSELAYIIARWPGQWWVREHSEIWDLIQAMVHVIGEEVRDAQRMRTLNEVKRLEGVVSELQLLTEEYVTTRSRSHSRTGSSTSFVSSVGSGDEADMETSRTSIRCDDSVQTLVDETMEIPKQCAETARPEQPYAPSKVETASCLLSSFFFGVFTALVVVSGQQRELAVGFT